MCEDHGDISENVLDISELTMPDKSGAAPDAKDDGGRKIWDAIMQYVVPYCQAFEEKCQLCYLHMFYVLDLMHANSVVCL